MPDQKREAQLRRAGHQSVAGVDEAGRGPLAGPVVAAAVILPPRAKLPGLDDSKALSKHQRTRLFGQIQDQAIDYSIGIVSAAVIDRINILQATHLAMWRALQGLQQADYVLIDGNRRLPHWEGPQETIVKGDAKVLAIAAASVLAKVTRDRIMERLGQIYPGYGLDQHMGYGTRAHCSQILARGLSPEHRRSFCAKLLARQNGPQQLSLQLEGL